MSERRGTIRDVARDTGLSVATISRVMNGAENVSRKTKEIVLEASQRLHYLPNPAARALTTKRSRTIAAIVPTLEHSIFARFLSAIEKELTRLDYSLVVAVSNSSEDELAAALKLLGMGAEGFILSGLAHAPNLLDLLQMRSVPYVLTSCWSNSSDQNMIGYDNADLAKKAIAYLYGLGHRDIGILHGPLCNNDRTQARLQGAFEFSGHKLQLNPVENELSVAGGLQAASSLLSRNQNVTAILCFSDVLALGATFHFQKEGILVPQDISLMGFDNLDWSTCTTPPLTTIDLPVVEMGRLASERLIRKLDHGDIIKSAKLDAKIVVRESTQMSTFYRADDEA